jgi:hypothetical protein
MAFAGQIMNMVGSVLNVASSVADSQQQAAERTYGWKLADANARQVGNQTAANEAQVRREARQTLGAQSAAIAESGTGFGGSNALIAAQDAALAELDALNIRYGGRLRMAGYDSEGGLLRIQKPDNSPISWQVHRARF